MQFEPRLKIHINNDGLATRRDSHVFYEEIDRKWTKEQWPGRHNYTCFTHKSASSVYATLPRKGQILHIFTYKRTREAMTQEGQLYVFFVGSANFVNFRLILCNCRQKHRFEANCLVIFTELSSKTRYVRQFSFDFTQLSSKTQGRG